MKNIRKKIDTNKVFSFFIILWILFFLFNVRFLIYLSLTRRHGINGGNENIGYYCGVILHRNCQNVMSNLKKKYKNE